MKSTRQHLLELIEHRPGITAAELSRALQLTQADIRHHLANMIKEGLIVSSGRQHSGRRGRPARRFSLASSVYKDNFDLLSSALLSASLDQLSPEQESTFLERVAGHLVPDKTEKGPLSQRLVQVVNQLNELGYQSRWEAHAEAPRVIFERCPFAALRAQHPELCRIDARQIEILCAEEVTLVESKAHMEDGFCMFLVG
ncbi:MAG: MarR family transcriptional regulator [Chloroflexota bacterium]|nr:MAG: MarR family transcriptional regulator [Chloroflexota bacterium]UCF27685.1 MAG: MarR family transcriptional regulator [Chloroflexota bacterium]